MDINDDGDEIALVKILHITHYVAKKYSIIAIQAVRCLIIF